MKITIVNAYGRSNRGDSVLLDECISEIISKHPNASLSGAVFEGIETICEIHPNIHWGERIGNTSIKGVLGKLITLFYIIISILATIDFLKPLNRLLPNSQKVTWENIVDADYVISAPGGYIHDTNLAYFIALLHIWLGCVTNSKVILAPQSIGPIDRNISRYFAKKIFQKSNIICARESYTYDFLINDLKIKKEIVHKTGDSAFWNFSINNDEAMICQIFENLGVSINTKTRIFGITVVNWSFPKSTNSLKDSEIYAQRISEIIDYIVEKYSCIPVIFNQVSEDLPMAERVNTYAKSDIYIDKESREPEVLRALIAKSSIFLGTRFHSCIFAMMAGRPTFAIAYLPKTSFILKDLKLEHRQTSIENLQVNRILNHLEYDLNNLQSAELEIDMAVNNYRKDFAQLRDFL